jgi:two-component system catabolic regulation response regulator CreB/two-component system response regulator ChvI
VLTLAGSSKGKILLVDDEPDITTIFRRALQNFGYSVDTYNEPERALANFKPDVYDLVILDYRMPGMNGVDLARAIWRVQPNAKICFVSAFEILTNELEAEFKNKEICTFLKKPVMPKVLAEHVEKQILNA